MAMMEKRVFKGIIDDLRDGMKPKDIAAFWKVSTRLVYLVKEAGSWERYPYMIAKKQHGYMTPEYKAYLKRRKLPVTPPAKPALRPARTRKKPETASSKPLIKRFTAWIRSLR